MTASPLLCVATGLDRLDREQLATRVAALRARVEANRRAGAVAVAAATGFNPNGSLDETLDGPAGRIRIFGRQAQVVIHCDAHGGLGDLELEAPMPSVAPDDLLDRVLRLFAVAVEAHPAEQGASGISTAGSGFSRLLRMVSAVLAQHAPASAGARVQIRCAFPWSREVDPYAASGHRALREIEPGILASGKPILSADVVRTLLALHPGASLNRVASGRSRSFKLSAPPLIDVRLPRVDALEAMRVARDLGLPEMSRPVLAAGTRLRAA